MKILKHLSVTALFLVGFFSPLIAQTIDYSSLSFSSNFCNDLNVSPPYQIGGFEHLPLSGGTTYNGSALVLQTKGGQSLSTTLGTAYAIEFPISFPDESYLA